MERETIVLPIYYQRYHNGHLTVNTLRYAQLLYEIISLQNIIMSKKRTFTYTYDCDHIIATINCGSSVTMVD